MSWVHRQSKVPLEPRAWRCDWCTKIPHWGVLPYSNRDASALNFPSGGRVTKIIHFCSEDCENEHDAESVRDALAPIINTPEFRERVVETALQAFGPYLDTSAVTVDELVDRLRKMGVCPDEG